MHTMVRTTVSSAIQLKFLISKAEGYGGQLSQLNILCQVVPVTFTLCWTVSCGLILSSNLEYRSSRCSYLKTKFYPPTFLRLKLRKGTKIFFGLLYCPHQEGWKVGLAAGWCKCYWKDFRKLWSEHRWRRNRSKTTTHIRIEMSS